MDIVDSRLLSVDFPFDTRGTGLASVTSSSKRSDTQWGVLIESKDSKVEEE